MPGFEDALVERAKIGLDELQEFTGPELGVAVVGAQDCALLLDYVDDDEGETPFDDETRDWLALWIQEAGYAALDQEAVTFLGDWLENFPITEAKRLGVVNAPFSEFEIQLLTSEKLTRPIPAPVTSVDLAMVQRARESEEILAADMDEPSEQLMQLLRLKNIPVAIPAYGTAYVGRELGEGYRLVLFLSGSAGNPRPPIRNVRFGFWPAKRMSVPTGDAWFIDMALFPQRIRQRIIRAEIWLTTDNGERICLQ